MPIKRISSGGVYEQKIGYCRAVVAGNTVYVAGTVAQGAEISADVREQCKSALSCIENALKEAGSGFADVVRVNYYLPNGDDFQECWDILAATFGENPPAATMIECALIDPKYKIEIEVTAYKGE